MPVSRLAHEEMSESHGLVKIQIVVNIPSFQMDGYNILQNHSIIIP